jgi:hypothetical protein
MLASVMCDLLPSELCGGTHWFAQRLALPDILYNVVCISFEILGGCALFCVV